MTNEILFIKSPIPKKVAKIPAIQRIYNRMVNNTLQKYDDSNFIDFL